MSFGKTAGLYGWWPAALAGCDREAQTFQKLDRDRDFETEMRQSECNLSDHYLEEAIVFFVI